MVSRELEGNPVYKFKYELFLPHLQQLTNLMVQRESLEVRGQIGKLLEEYTGLDQFAKGYVEGSITAKEKPYSVEKEKEECRKIVLSGMNPRALGMYFGIEDTYRIIDEAEGKKGAERGIFLRSMGIMPYKDWRFEVYPPGLKMLAQVTGMSLKYV